MDGSAEFARHDGSLAVSRDELLASLQCPPTTTTHVNLFIVKPDTIEAGCPYARMLVRSGSKGTVGPPTVFLSHAWRYPFKDLVDVVLERFENDSELAESVYLWNDIFVEDQKCSDAKPNDYFATAFKETVA